MIDYKPENYGLELPFSSKVDLASLSPEVREIVFAETKIPVSVESSRTLRVKILDLCGMTCTFCHNEGTPVSQAYWADINSPNLSYSGGRVSVFQERNRVNFLAGVMHPDYRFEDAITKVKNAIGVNEVHFTGGEPTLHQELVDLVAFCTELGYKVRLTSNGENGANVIADCKKAGLEKINFSIFGITPEELAMVQAERYGRTRLAAKKIDALDASIHSAVESGVPISLNVVMRDLSDRPRLEHLIDKYGRKEVTIRILNDLSGGDESYLAIYELLCKIGAEPSGIKIEAGGSSTVINYSLGSDKVLGFKQIRRSHLDECRTCEFNNPDDCKEGYYGTRLYVDQDGEYHVGVCIQRMDLVQHVGEFARSGLARQVAELRENEERLLKERYAGRLVS